jgi:hypothetical protein
MDGKISRGKLFAIIVPPKSGRGDRRLFFGIISAERSKCQKKRLVCTADWRLDLPGSGDLFFLRRLESPEALVK